MDLHFQEQKTKLTLCSSIFHKETEDLFNTFENHSIDAICGSAANYEISDNHQQENKTQLKQLFSTEPIHPIIKARWHSLTDLHIRDGKFINNLLIYLFFRF